MSERIQFTKSVNRVLVPCLLELGFTVEGEGNPRIWKEGCLFKRVRNGRHHAILFGRVVSGHALGWNIICEVADGKCDYMDFTKYGLTLAKLAYQTQAELDEVLEGLARFARNEMAAWYDAHAIVGSNRDGGA